MSARPVRVLYIAGNGRSGSTLLERTLGQLPSFVALGEMKHIWFLSFTENRLCGCGRPFSDCPFWQDVLRHAFGAKPPASGVSLQQAVDRLRHIPQMRFASENGPYGKRKKQFTDRILRLYRAAVEVSGSTVILDASKDIAMLYLLSRLPEIDLHVLHLIRDSRGVAYSWSRKKRPEITDMAQYPAYRAGWKWMYVNMFIEMVFARRHANYHAVRYEEFVQEPAQTIRSIAAFVGEEVHELPFLKDRTLTLRQANHTVAGNPIRFHQGTLQFRLDSAWKDEMRTMDRLIVTTITFPLLRYYGYAL